jgi:hypothetical protein
MRFKIVEKRVGHTLGTRQTQQVEAAGSESHHVSEKSGIVPQIPPSIVVRNEEGLNVHEYQTRKSGLSELVCKDRVIKNVLIAAWLSNSRNSYRGAR